MHYSVEEEALVFLLLAREVTTDTRHSNVGEFIWTPESSRNGQRVALHILTRAEIH